MRNPAKALLRRLWRPADTSPSGPPPELIQHGPAGDRTSITHYGRYLDICAKAASDPEVFSRFRSETAYIEVLDHVTQKDGAEYLKVLRRDYPELVGDRLANLRRNDLYGSPNTYQYPAIGVISPTTLRYTKVLGDLGRFFGDLSGGRIIEIGVGYGGQCRLIASTWPLASYTLVDLGPALDLARIYLGKFAAEPAMSPDRFEFKGPDATFDDPYDLCISNYAFTELSREMQERYVDGVVRPSRSGYMTCNFISGGFGIDSMQPEELIALHPDAEWLPEEPLTHPDNRILVWGRSSGER